MTTELSSTTKALLRAARTDGPGAAARARILDRIASGTSGAPAAATVAKATLAAGGSAKLLAAGALFGSVVTVGVAAMLLHVGAPKLTPDPLYGVHADSEISAIAPATHGTALDVVTAPAPKPLSHGIAHPASIKARVAPAQAFVVDPDSDPLQREAALVAEARSAIARGEPGVALGALRATETLTARAMEPEELSLKARALRASGREPEAAFVDAQLKALFPDNALSR